jgi:hypothetical protein
MKALRPSHGPSSPHQQGTVQRTASGSLGVGSLKVFESVPEQQLITEHLLLPGKNRLPGNEAEILMLVGGGWGSERRGGVHLSYIGRNIELLNSFPSGAGGTARGLCSKLAP